MPALLPLAAFPVLAVADLYAIYRYKPFLDNEAHVGLNHLHCSSANLPANRATTHTAFSPHVITASTKRSSYAAAICNREYQT
jgi:hypothetical protein